MEQALWCDKYEQSSTNGRKREREKGERERERENEREKESGGLKKGNVGGVSHLCAFRWPTLATAAGYNAVVRSFVR